MKRCALYRHFDKLDVLLYVGITDSLAARGRQHAAGAPWAEFAARASVVWFDDRASAEEAERKAIATEEPVYNRAGAVGDSAARVAAYLADRKGQVAHRKHETFLTLREAVRRRVTPYDLRTLRRARRQGVRFPAHAGWDRARRVYSEEALAEWAASLQLGPFGLWPVLTRAELRDVHRGLRLLRRARTRGTRGGDNL